MVLINTDLIIPSNEAKTFKNMCFKERLTYIKDSITVEPLVSLCIIAKTLIVPAVTSLHFEKACKVNAGFNDTVCDAILSSTYLHGDLVNQNNVVQSYLTQGYSWELPVANILPTVLMLFAGSYSDRYNFRKPFLLATIIGNTLQTIAYLLNVIFVRSWSLEILIVLTTVIPAFLGNEQILLTLAFAYVADVSTIEMRTFRISLVKLSAIGVTPIFILISGTLFKTFGYFVTFGSSLLILIVAFIYCVFVIKEHKKIVKHERKGFIKDFFNVTHVTETFKLLGPHKSVERSNLICISILWFIYSSVVEGELSVGNLFAQSAYQWTIVDYTYFRSAVLGVAAISMVTVVPLFIKVLRLGDIRILMMSFTNDVISRIILVTFKSSVGFYIGNIFTCLIPCNTLALKSQFTKLVSPDDIAKSFTLCEIVSSLAIVSAAEIYHQGIYENTREKFPQAYFLYGMGMYSMGIVILTWMYYKEWRLKKSTSSFGEKQSVKECPEKF